VSKREKELELHILVNNLLSNTLSLLLFESEFSQLIL